MNLKHVRIYKAADGWRWTAVARNNRIVGASEQGYRRKWYAKRTARQQFGKAFEFVEGN